MLEALQWATLEQHHIHAKQNPSRPSTNIALIQTTLPYPIQIHHTDVPSARIESYKQSFSQNCALELPIIKYRTGIRYWYLVRIN